MTITSYSTLQSTIGDFLNRSDLTSQIPVFIQLAEARFNREIRHWRMETNTTLTADAQYEDLPTDWLQTIKLTINGEANLVLRTRDYIAEQRALYEDATGEPHSYTFTAGQIEFYPTPNGSQTVNHVYFGSIPALSDSNTTNWLLDNAPDAYLYGALLHSAPYLVEDQRLAVWEALHGAAITSLNVESDKARNGSSGLRISRRNVR